MRFRTKLLACVAAIAALTGATTAQAALSIDETFNGQWFEVGQPVNRGWQVQYFRGGPEWGVLFVIGFVYDAEGNPFWVSGSVFVRPNTFKVDIPLLEYDGGDFGPSIVTPTSSNWGTLSLEFHDCNNATFSWSGNADIPDGSIEEMQLERGYGTCVYQEPFDACPNHPNVSTAMGEERACILTGTITEDIALTNNATWLLNGGVFVGEKDAEDNDVSMWIEPGTRILGIGSGGADFLTISRGGKLYAEGQPYAPIIFTSANFAESPVFPEETPAAAGDWGGLVLNGFAPLNVGGDGTADGEGDSGTYGGDDPHDSSGVLRFVRVQFAGNLITDLDELNGIAFQGVGDGTVVDSVQVHSNSDDGIEFFGGTVNVSRIVITAAQDDSIDWTQGYKGRIQYGLVVQQQSDEVETDKGMELDNFSRGQDNEPRSQPQVSHLTLIGNPEKSGIVMRAGTGVNFSNIIVYGFKTCIDIDEQSTFDAAVNNDDATDLTGTLTMENSIVMCIDANFKDNETETDDDDNPIFTDPWLVSDWYTNQPNNFEGDPMLDGLFPEDGSMFQTGFYLDTEGFGNHPGFDSFFDQSPQIGAFLTEQGAWHYKWTDFIEENLPDNF